MSLGTQTSEADGSVFLTQVAESPYRQLFFACIVLYGGMRRNFNFRRASCDSLAVKNGLSKSVKITLRSLGTSQSTDYTNLIRMLEVSGVRITDVAGGLHIGRIAENVLNKLSRTTDKRWSPSLWG
jgi:hypothetical protein